MNMKFVFIAMLSLSTVACKPELQGTWVSGVDSTLRLFEEQTGALLDVKDQKFEIEAVTKSLMPTEDSLMLRIKSGDHAFVVRIPKAKIATDGKFELSEDDTEQPLKIKGSIESSQSDNTFAKLLGAENIKIQVQIYKGFAFGDREIATLKTEVKDFKASLISAGL